MKKIVKNKFLHKELENMSENLNIPYSGLEKDTKLIF